MPAIPNPIINSEDGSGIDCVEAAVAIVFNQLIPHTFRSDALATPSAVKSPADQALGLCNQLRPDEVADPAETWTPGSQAPWVPADEVHDRIDLIYHQGFGVEVTDIAIVGESEAVADIVITRYPSDRRAVVATYDLPPTPLLGDVNVDGVIDQADANVIIDHWLEKFEFGGVSTFVLGDLTRNGIVDIRDVNIFQRGLVAANPQAAIDWSGLSEGIPEPASLGLLIVGFAPLVRLRRTGLN